MPDFPIRKNRKNNNIIPRETHRNQPKERLVTINSLLSPVTGTPTVPTTVRETGGVFCIAAGWAESKAYTGKEAASRISQITMVRMGIVKIKERRTLLFFMKLFNFISAWFFRLACGPDQRQPGNPSCEPTVATGVHRHDQGEFDGRSVE